VAEVPGVAGGGRVQRPKCSAWWARPRAAGGVVRGGHFRRLAGFTHGHADEPEGAAREKEMLAGGPAHGLRLVGPTRWASSTPSPSEPERAHRSASPCATGGWPVSSLVGAIGCCACSGHAAAAAWASVFGRLGNRADVSRPPTLSSTGSERRGHRPVVALYRSHSRQPAALLAGLGAGARGRAASRSSPSRAAAGAARRRLRDALSRQGPASARRDHADALRRPRSCSSARRCAKAPGRRPVRHESGGWGGGGRACPPGGGGARAAWSFAAPGERRARAAGRRAARRRPPGQTPIDLGVARAEWPMTRGHRALLGRRARRCGLVLHVELGWVGIGPRALEALEEASAARPSRCSPEW